MIIYFINRYDVYYPKHDISGKDLELISQPYYINGTRIKGPFLNLNDAKRYLKNHRLVSSDGNYYTIESFEPKPGTFVWSDRLNDIETYNRES